MPVHVASSEGDAKFWLEPELKLAENDGIPEREISTVAKILERRRHEVEAAWRKHFAS